MAIYHKACVIMAVLVSTLCASASGGEIQLELRTQLPAKTDHKWQPFAFEQNWPAEQTAIIICDMWNKHWSRGASERVAAMAPRMNEVVKAARNIGITIIHAPSETMDFYKDTPARRRVQEAPRIAAPKMDERENPRLPVDASDGGSDTGEKPWYKAWTREHPAIEIDQARDGISDSGQEIWNFMQAKGIKRLLIMGVHANMCILNRPFAIGPMVRRGVQVALVRDLTDAMYNPAMPPHVSHDEGARLVVDYIEKYFCPTITSEQLLKPRRQSGGQTASMEKNNKGVAGMLLKNHWGTLELLPALPKTRPSGDIRGLRARRGVEADLTWRNGRLTTAAFHSRSNAKLRIRIPKAQHMLAIKDNGFPVKWDAKSDGTITLKMLAGHRYEIYGD